MSILKGGDKGTPTATNQREWCVTWAIDVSATSPEAAAREAWEAMRRPDTTATVFDVVERKPQARRTQIDLGSAEFAAAAQNRGDLA